MPNAPRIMIAVFLGACLPAPALSQSGSAGSEPPCANQGYRAFDFWVGNWEVTNPEGKMAGTNRIERVYGGCALRESWEGSGGMKGTSLNTYQPRTDTWHQTWIDDRGTFLMLQGGIRNGAMILSGSSIGENGPYTNRITWTPLPSGQVRQHWEVSRDSGSTWKTVFDGVYTRVGE